MIVPLGDLRLRMGKSQKIIQFTLDEIYLPREYVIFVSIPTLQTFLKITTNEILTTEMQQKI